VKAGIRHSLCLLALNAVPCWGRVQHRALTPFTCLGQGARGTGRPGATCWWHGECPDSAFPWPWQEIITGVRPWL